MFPLFETIAIENGKIKNIALHQARYERSLITYYGKSAVTFFNLLDLIQVPKELHNKFVRCRIDYNAHQTQISYLEYTPKTHRVFKPIVCNEIDYSSKYADRELINTLFAQKGEADEIIIIKDSFVTDCSIGNLAFRKGTQWFTPNTPLLKGTQREYLLQSGQLQEIEIRQEQLEQFDEIRVINALNEL